MQSRRKRMIKKSGINELENKEKHAICILLKENDKK